MSGQRIELQPVPGSPDVQAVMSEVFGQLATATPTFAEVAEGNEDTGAVEHWTMEVNPVLPKLRGIDAVRTLKTLDAVMARASYMAQLMDMQDFEPKAVP